MIDWGWLIPAFLCGGYLFLCVRDWIEQRSYRNQTTELYEQAYRKQKQQWHEVAAKDFQQELELHKN